MRSLPQEKIPKAIVGQIQWMSGLADQANQKNDIGSPTLPIIAGNKNRSGESDSEFFSKSELAFA